MRRERPQSLAVALLLLLCTFVFCATAPAQMRSASPRFAPTFPCSILRRLPHDPTAFTQGLIMHQGAFLESTGLYGQSSLRRVDPETGRVLSSTLLARRFFAEGLALCPGAHGNVLAQLTWKENVVLTYDAETLRPLRSQRLSGEGWGLACQPHSPHSPGLFLKSDGTDTLRLLNPDTLAEVGRLRVTDNGAPVRQLNELEWHNGWILANIWGSDVIALIRGDTGRVAAWLDLAPLRRELNHNAEAANGIAVDRSGRRIYVTGKRWNILFVLEMPELLTSPPR